MWFLSLSRVVPIANGYELRQGLLDVGVHCEMAVYTGYGHGITKPKSQRAVLSHNKDWFGEHWCTSILCNNHSCAHFSDD
jgi:dipeptidyl aminopeptidase/acylaminoacyl peptidase